jgi:hypothetical protein
MAFLSNHFAYEVAMQAAQVLGVIAEDTALPVTQRLSSLMSRVIDLTQKLYVFASFYTCLVEMSPHYILEYDLEEGLLDGETGFVWMDLALYWDLVNNHRFPESDLHMRISRILDALHKINPLAFDGIREAVQGDIKYLQDAFPRVDTEHEEIIEMMPDWSENAAVDPAVLVERLQVAAICGVNAYGHWARLGGFEIPLAIPVLECYHDACDNYTRMVSALIYNERAIAVMS